MQHQAISIQGRLQLLTDDFIIDILISSCQTVRAPQTVPDKLGLGSHFLSG